MNEFEREEDEIIEAYNNGEITKKEFNEEMRALVDQFKCGAQEAADEAYDNYMG